MTSAHRALVLIPFVLSTACFRPGEGKEPPLEEIYFPTGLAVDAQASRLYVVNSDFDLQYNGGSLQAMDLERVRGMVPRYCAVDADCGADERCDLTATEENRGLPSHWCVATSGEWAGAPCGPFGEKSNADRWLEPGRCDYVKATHPQDGGESLVVGRVGIGAFATDVVYRQARADDGSLLAWGRLFVPVRGDATLHYLDVEPGVTEIDCGQQGNHGDCNDAHRVGDDPDTENTRDLRMPPEPFGVDATADGEAVAVTHQTDGSVSLFVNDWNDRPRLEWVSTGLPSRVVGIAAVPEPAVASGASYQPGFLVTYRVSAEIDLFRYFADASNSSANERPFLELSGAVDVAANSVGYDSRGIAVDAAERRACEAACSEDDACLATCAGIPLGVYVGNRSPNSLLVGRTRTNASATSSDDLPTFYDSVPMPYGVSRVVVGQVIDAVGELQTRVFVMAFDQRKVAIYDPVARRIEKFIETGRGPHSLVVDVGRAGESEGAPSYAFAYIAHFTDSYIGVVDLDLRHPTYGEIVLTIGSPTPPRASK